MVILMDQAIKGALLDRRESDNIVASPSLKNIEKEDEILKLPSQIFNPARMLIVSSLWKHEELDFKTLREGIHARTDGTLASHLRILENLGIIQYHKEFSGRKPRTTYKLTEQGKQVFQKLVEGLKLSISDDI